MDLRELQSSKLVLIGNVWDVNSATLVEELAYDAIGTSSAAIARSFGYKDGEDLPFELTLTLVKRIRECTSKPLTVDIEWGYGDTPVEIAKNIKLLSDLGVSGVNIEDSVVLEGQRQLVAADKFKDKLQQINNELIKLNVDVFINVRIDTYLLSEEAPLQQTLERISQYEMAGAEGVFVPYLVCPNEVSKVLSHTKLPLNLLSHKEMCSVNELQEMGVRRLSMGNRLYEKTSIYSESLFKSVLEQQCYSTVA
ncbi:isocitrate lyase/PEP mutase family protein [Vibrio sonorensis]|uniref:isocitrate lyase/PEP mutase family protein n=1 Tax=Vibrio sonorensis TaxID=1004316 RepID=UPI0008DA4BFB|nr:isocitrate lyase/phosphoenolpyruvate mutase family protein [Vibrio sonorensis]